MRNQLGVFHFRVVKVQRLATYDALSWFQHAIHVFDVVARTRQRIPVMCAFGVQRHGRCFTKQRHKIVHIVSKINNLWEARSVQGFPTQPALQTQAESLLETGVSVEKEVQTRGITRARTNCAPNIRVKLMFSLKYAPGHLVGQILRGLIGQVVIIAKTTVNSERRPALATSSDVPYLSRGAIALLQVHVLPGA